MSFEMTMESLKNERDMAFEKGKNEAVDEMLQVYTLYRGMTESMQVAIIEIMKVSQKGGNHDNNN